MDNIGRSLKKDLWWMVPLLILALVFLITGFDPIGDLVGQQNKRWVSSLITILLIAYILFRSTKRK